MGYRQTCRAHRGMTLVEVLAVVVILGLIASTLLVGFGGAFAKGKQELARTGIGLVSSRLEMYRMEHNAWPSAEDGLRALRDSKPSASYHLGRDQILDPWGREYELVIPGPDGLPYEIISLGADGLRGGEGEDADLTSAALREERT